MATYTTLEGKTGYGDGEGVDTHIIGADALKVSISGNMNGDTINIEGLAADYKIKAKGRTITLTDGVQTIVFKVADAGTVNLNFLDGGLDVTFNSKKASVEGQNLGGKFKSFSDANLENLDAASSSADVFADLNAATPFVLTTAVDNLVGTGGNDLLLGAVTEDTDQTKNTFQAADLIDGGAGIDTLHMTLSDNLNEDMMASVSNIEILKVRDVYGANVDLSGVVGLKQIWQVDSNDNWTDFHDIEQAATIGLKGGTNGAYFEFEAGAVGTDGIINVALDNAGKANDSTELWVDVDSSDTIKQVNINNVGTSNVEFYDYDDNHDIETFVITGSGSLELRSYQEEYCDFEEIKNFDASKFTGSLRMWALDNDQNLTYKGGSGNDDLVLEYDELNANDVIDGGAGVNTLTVADVGEDGFDSATNSTVLGIQAAKNIQVLAFDIDGYDTTIDASLFTQKEYSIHNEGYDVNFDSISANTKIELKGTYLSGDEYAEYWWYEHDYVDLDAANGVQSVTVVLDGQGDIDVDVYYLDVQGGFSTLNLDSTGTTDEDNDIDYLYVNDNTIVNITGDSDLYIGSIDDQVTVNASQFTGALELEGSSDNDNITTGSGGSELYATGGNDIYNFGSGKDVLVFNGVDSGDGSTTALDVINQFAVASDKIDISNGGYNVTELKSQVVVQAAITQGAPQTLADAVAIAATSIGANNFGAFQFGNNTYVLANNGDTTYNSGDLLIQLTGKLSLTAANFVLADVV